MAATNTKTRNAFKEVTHEGGRAARTTNVQALRRSVMSCMLFENEFYEDGQTIADRIIQLSAVVPTATLAEIAIEAREVAKLRHVPLLLLTALCRHGSGSSIVSETITRVIQRADELSELLAVYWKVNGKDASLSSQLKLGLAGAFGKFDAYQIAKYDRERDIRLRDVLFLSHAKPATDERAKLYRGLVDQTLKSPDTWEVALSSGGDKKTEFTRLLIEGRLGYLALLRNLRNMEQSGVDRGLVIDAIKARKGADRVLPFRFIAAARAAATFEPALDEALIASIQETRKLPGRTVVLVDVSASMKAQLSAKSDLTRMDAACALASVIAAEDLQVFSFSNQLVKVPARRGMAGVDAISRSQPSGSTELFRSVLTLNEKVLYDRLIVITDEQATATAGSSAFSRNPLPLGHGFPAPKGLGYMINVASAKNGVGYGPWVHIDGFSENVLRYIAQYENAHLSDEVD